MSITKNGRLIGSSVGTDDFIILGNNDDAKIYYDGTDLNINLGPNAIPSGFPYPNYPSGGPDIKPSTFLALTGGIKWNPDTSSSSPEGSGGIYSYVNNYNDLFFELNDNDWFVVQNHTSGGDVREQFMHFVHDGTLRLKGYDSWCQIISGSNALVAGQKWGVARGDLALDIQSTHYWDAVAIGDYSVCLGLNVRADGREAISIGNASYAALDNSICIGAHNGVWGDSSIAVGLNNTIALTGNDSLIFGNSNNIYGNNSTAIGRNCLVSGDGSTTIGPYVETYVDNTTEIGSWNTSGERVASIRIHPNGQLAASFRTASASPVDGGAIAGYEPDGSLPRGMYTIQKVFDDITLFYNTVSGDVEYAIVGSTNPVRLVSYFPSVSSWEYTPSASDTWEKILLPTTPKSVKDWSFIDIGSPSGDIRYQYTGAVPKNFTVDATMSFSTGTANETLELAMSNGTSGIDEDHLEEGVYNQTFMKNAGQVYNMNILGWFSCDPGDVIAVWIKTDVGATITFESASIRIVEVI